MFRGNQSEVRKADEFDMAEDTPILEWIRPLLEEVFVVVVVIVALYYLMSPYQNCTREHSAYFCTRETNW